MQMLSAENWGSPAVDPWAHWRSGQALVLYGWPTLHARQYSLYAVHSVNYAHGSHCAFLPVGLPISFMITTPALRQSYNFQVKQSWRICVNALHTSPTNEGYIIIFHGIYDISLAIKLPFYHAAAGWFGVYIYIIYMQNISYHSIHGYNVDQNPP